MFFVLSKVIYWLVMPTSLLAWIMIASLVIKKGKYKRLLRNLSLWLFLFFTNPLISTLAINAWEPPAIPYDQIHEKYTYGIVLSGITNPDRPPFDRVHFNKGADRIVHAMDLYKRGVISKIIITGGSGKALLVGNKESHALRDFATQNGIPEQDVLVEDQARNTHENALYTSELINDPLGKMVLITSAFHMPRALRCFEKMGLEVVPFPTDHYGRMMNYTPDETIIPTLFGLNIWTILTKEWLGMLAYKLSGYI